MYFRWEVCTTATQARFSAKVSQLYANSNEGKRTRTQTSKLVESLRHSFQDLLEAADWMDQGSMPFSHVLKYFIFLCNVNFIRLHMNVTTYSMFRY